MSDSLQMCVDLVPLEESEKQQKSSGRAEIDTSAPFESVKEAVTRFGGVGYWKPSQHNTKPDSEEHDIEETDLVSLEEQATQLEKDLICKENETFAVLKELEATKATVEELKSRLQKDALGMNLDPVQKGAENVNRMDNGRSLVGVSGPGLILKELEQAKLNLSKTTYDLHDIRCSVQVLNKKLDIERKSLMKTRERLTENSSKIHSLEEELNQTKLKLQLADDPSVVSQELQRLSCEAEQFKKMGETARSEVMRSVSEIELTKSKIETAETRLFAARKMKEAARASEGVALAEIKVLSDTKQEMFAISYEEYSSLTENARDAKERSNKKVMAAENQVDEANVLNNEILKKVEEATEEVKNSKKALEEALKSVEAANNAKLDVEEALRKWRSEKGMIRKSVHNTTKFKNSNHSQHKRESSPSLTPTLSIGQILSRKLLLPEGSRTVKGKVSLSQMLCKPNGDGENCKQLTGKRKQFGFGRFSLLAAKEKESKKKKKRTLNLR